MFDVKWGTRLVEHEINTWVIEYRFYEKETFSTKTVQTRTAMDENSKHQVLANDQVRRLCNSMEGLGEGGIVRVDS